MLFFIIFYFITIMLSRFFTLKKRGYLGSTGKAKAATCEPHAISADCSQDHLVEVVLTRLFSHGEGHRGDQVAVV